MATRQLAHREAAGGSAVGTAAGHGGPLARWVRRHPVGAFLAWFFTVGWALSFLPLVARAALDLPVPAWADLLFIVASTLLWLLLPAVAITRLVDGPQGVRALLGRMLPPRAAAGWYAVALLAVPVTALLGALLLYGRPGAAASTLLAALAGGQTEPPPRGRD